MGRPIGGFKMFQGSDREKILEYLKQVSTNQGVYACFLGVEPYKVLFSNKTLIKGTLIRRQHTRGGADDVYRVTGDGKLEGVIDISFYPGFEGTFDPEQLLTERENPEGWILSPMILPGIIRRLEKSQGTIL